MCLPVILQRPDCVLRYGYHRRHKWVIVHNGMGYRCGYVRIPEGHPWHGLHYDDIDVACHGGLTYSRADVPCEGETEPGGWWIGFDCAHAGDAQDPTLAPAHRHNRVQFEGDTVKDSDYVQLNCEFICDQAWLEQQGIALEVDALIEETRHES